MRFPRSIFFALFLASLSPAPAGLFADGDAKPTVDIEVIANLRFSIINTCWKNADSGLVRTLTFDEKKVWLTVDGFPAASDEWNDYGNGQYRTSGSLFTLAADGKHLFERTVAGNSTRTWERTADPVVTPEPANPAPPPVPKTKAPAPPVNDESEPSQKTKKLRAFAWTSADVSNQFETLELNLGSKIKSAGTLEVDFCYGDGFSGIETESVALAVDGKIVSEDKHPGACGFPFSSRGTRYVLTVPKNAVGTGKLSLILRIMSFGNRDTCGNIVLGGEAARAINEKIRGGLLGDSVRQKTFWQSPENGLYYVFSADGAAWATIADRAGERWMKGSWRIVGNNPARLEADFSKSRISVRGRSSTGGETGPRADFPKKTRVRFVISENGKTLERDDGEIFAGKDSV